MKYLIAGSVTIILIICAGNGFCQSVDYIEGAASGRYSSSISWQNICENIGTLKNELELTESQIREIKEENGRIADWYKKECERLKRDHKNVSTTYVKELNSVQAELPRLHKQQIEKVLMPHQKELLYQMAFWAQANTQTTGLARALFGLKVFDELNVPLNEQRKIEADAAKLQAQFDRDLLKLRKKYLDKIAERKLDKKRQKELSELFGRLPDRVWTVIRF